MQRSHLLFVLLPLFMACKNNVEPPSDQAQAAKLNLEGKNLKSGFPSTILSFGGYNWTVKSGSGLGPGPNTWSDQNVWIDTNGWMHLKLSYDAVTAKWLCAGVTSTTNFAYGTFQWKIQGPVSTLDKNVVVGLFNYAGPDGYNEMDVEFARWGNTANPNVNYSVYPASGSSTAAQHSTTNWTQTGGTSSTHRYTWTSSSVVFKSMNGLYDDDTNMFFTHIFTPPVTSIPTISLPVKMNLWCFHGTAPTDGQNVEVIIKAFKYTPAN